MNILKLFTSNATQGNGEVEILDFEYLTLIVKEEHDVEIKIDSIPVPFNLVIPPVVLIVLQSFTTKVLTIGFFRCENSLSSFQFPLQEFCEHFIPCTGTNNFQIFSATIKITFHVRIFFDAMG